MKNKATLISSLSDFKQPKKTSRNLNNQNDGMIPSFNSTTNEQLISVEERLKQSAQFTANHSIFNEKSQLPLIIRKQQ